jgi:hypothetical protein
MTAVPIEKDALDGPITIEILARVAAQTGETDRAITALQKLLSIPSGGALAAGVPLTPALLRLDPMFDLLRYEFYRSSVTIFRPEGAAHKSQTSSSQFETSREAFFHHSEY